MYNVYILKSISTGKHYIGYTQDLNRRLSEHNKGKTKSTKDRGPFRVILSERFNKRNEAYKREQQIKSYKGGEAFKKLINQCGIG